MNPQAAALPALLIAAGRPLLHKLAAPEAVLEPLPPDAPDHARADHHHTHNLPVPIRATVLRAPEPMLPRPVRPLGLAAGVAEHAAGALA